MVGAGGDGGQEDREGGSRTHQRQQMRCVARARCASRPRRPYLALQRLPPPGLPEILGKSVAQYIYYINVIHWVLLRIGALLGLLLFDSPHRLRHLQLLSALALRSILRAGWGGGMGRRGERDERKRRCVSVEGSKGGSGKGGRGMRSHEIPQWLPLRFHAAPVRALSTVCQRPPAAAPPSPPGALSSAARSCFGSLP